jgi:sterol desaturase/sphingolipid hydroxylase (fatty acid hydroxylase superfamily)
LLIYNAASNVVVNSFQAILGSVFGIKNLLAVELQTLPYWLILVIGFMVRDFVQWWTHRLLHKIPFLWEFHKVHHSVKEMGFAAHLRYHWMETIVYRTLEYLPLALLGIGLYDFFIIHIFTIAVGHFNHANWHPSSPQKGAIFGSIIGFFMGTVALHSPYWWAFGIGGAIIGVLAHPIWGYIFNSPDMHIWHHAKYIPFPDGTINGAFDNPKSPYRAGINFGISLSCWDYIFGTAYIPHDGRDIELGFENDEVFPTEFTKQELYPFL